MKFLNSSQNWSERKKIFQMKRLQILISIKESYERKLAAISGSISKLEEQIKEHSQNTES